MIRRFIDGVAAGVLIAIGGCVYLACDGDPAITGPVAESCAAAGVEVMSGHTMQELGRACRITVGASVVAVLSE